MFENHYVKMFLNIKPFVPNVPFLYPLKTFDDSVGNKWANRKGSSIKYVRKIFRKTNISNPLIRTHVRVCNRGLEMLVFREILRTYLMDGP